MRKKFRRWIGIKIRRRELLPPLIKKIIFGFLDTIDKLKYPNTLIPPRRFRFRISSDYIEEGIKVTDLIIEHGGLQPNHKILDIGCGVGRIAINLTKYLSNKGEYWGFDIRKEDVVWAQNNITPKHNNFHFEHSDIYNKSFNENGVIRAQDYSFAFEDDTFDFIYLISVFTHMLPEDMENYISEISRLLKTGGKCFLTIFVLSDELDAFSHIRSSALSFRHKRENYRISIEDAPEAAIAFPEDYIKNLFEENRLKIFEHKRAGSWFQGETFMEAQDLIVLTK